MNFVVLFGQHCAFHADFTLFVSKYQGFYWLYAYCVKSKTQVLVLNSVKSAGKSLVPHTAREFTKLALAGLAGKAAQHTGGCQLSVAQHHL